MDSVFAKRIGLAVGVLTLIAFGIQGFDWAITKVRTHDINGQWKFTFVIQRSSLKRYDGMSAGYRIFINDDNGKIDGKGQKLWVNDEKIPYSQHDRFEISGVNKDGSVKCNYILHGQIATTAGGFELKILNDKLMEGTFAGNAAETNGKVTAVKEVN